MSDPNTPSGDDPQTPSPSDASDAQPTVQQPQTSGYGQPYDTQPTLQQPQAAGYGQPYAPQQGQPQGQQGQPQGYQGYQGYPQGYPAGVTAPPVQPPKGLAIAAMVVGIISLLLSPTIFVGVIGGIVAVVLGIVALKKAQPKGMSIAGIVTGGIAILASVVLFIASAAFLDAAMDSATSVIDSQSEQLIEETEEPASEPTAEPEPTEPAEPEKPAETAEPTWTTVATIEGNADQQSDTITLTGGKVRVTYEFTDPSSLDMIIGAIYVLDEGVDLTKDGGIPDVMVSEAGSGETVLRKDAGEYYVKVTVANADYTITIEEEK